MDYADSVRLVSEQSTSIKQFDGFQKHHRVPNAANAGDQRFVSELAEPQIDRDMQEVFSALRKSYGLKRKEISVDGPTEGGGVVTTPFFCYQIQVQQDEDSPSNVIWARSITEITEPARVFAGPFDEVFGRQFSVLEISTHKDLTWCELNVLDSTTSVMLSDNCIRVVSRQEITPLELIKSFLEIKTRFIATLSVSDVPFLAEL